MFVSFLYKFHPERVAAHACHAVLLCADSVSVAYTAVQHAKPSLSLGPLSTNYPQIPCNLSDSYHNYAAI